MGRIRVGLVSGVWVLLLFAAVFGVVLDVPVAKASGTIYIRSDGSVDPSTAPIRHEGDLYTFLDNINEPIVIERDNVIVDGAGYKLQGIGAADSKGVDIPKRNNVVIRNLEISAFGYGIYLNCSQNTRIIGNKIANGTEASRGIFFDNSSNNAILRNNIRDQFMGIYAYPTRGLGHLSSHNIILENNITNNEYGLYLHAGALFNIVAGNNIDDYRYGVTIYGANNTFVHNNFMDSISVQTNSRSHNVWDDGYPSGGNYWGDFEGRYPDVKDVYSGSYQNETGSDEIWDQSYGIRYLDSEGGGFIESGYRDNYPFVSPCAPVTYHGLVILTLTTPEHAAVSDSLSINATVTNQGLVDENNVEFRLLVNGTAVDSVMIPLLKMGGSHALSYSWTPTAKGKYNITAYAHPASGEKWVERNQQSKFITVWPLPGVKAGDWIKYDYTATTAPPKTTIPTWTKMEILAIEGTNITLRLTMHLSNETEKSEALTVDFARYYSYYPSGTLDTLFGRCFIIAANATAGVDRVNIGLMQPPVGLSSNLTGETVKTYVGASRTVIYLTWPGYLGWRYGSQPLKYHWDKKTGVLVEASATINGVLVTAEATETNMWQAQSLGLPFDQIYLYVLVAVIVAIAVGAIAFVMRRRRKPPEAVAPTATT